MSPTTRGSGGTSRLSWRRKGQFIFVLAIVAYGVMLLVSQRLLHVEPATVAYPVLPTKHVSRIVATDAPTITVLPASATGLRGGSTEAPVADNADAASAAAATAQPQTQATAAIASQLESASTATTAAGPEAAPVATSVDRSNWTEAQQEAELVRLTALKQAKEEIVTKAKAELDEITKLYADVARDMETIFARRALDLRRHEPRKVRRLKCLGWKQTAGCSPYGAREPDNDRDCNQVLSGGLSGYCEMLDEDTNEHFRVMQLNCSSVRTHVTFSCSTAGDFGNFAVKTLDIMAQARSKALTKDLVGMRGTGNGIVMVVYPKLITSAYATIRVLRSFGCTLPIEVWYLQSEMARAVKKQGLLGRMVDKFAPMQLRPIEDNQITGFATKVHAIYHSSFESVLFLDADNVPVRDPSFLFQTPQFLDSGAIFWPDFWHPRNTIFNIHGDSLLWELVDMDFIDMFEQESGQLVINRRKSAVALEVLAQYAFDRPSHFNRLILAHGDKDLFRLAWLKTSSPFHMIAYPPGAAGPERHGQFCGMTMVQFDPKGDVLFLHRNAKKLSGRLHQLDEAYWTHLQTFDWRPLDENRPKNGGDGDNEAMMSYAEITDRYVISIQGSAPLFREFQSCYGASTGRTLSNFKLTPFPYGDLEKNIIQYAHEAARDAWELPR